MKRLENRDRIQGEMPSVKPTIERRAARWASRDRVQAHYRYELRQQDGDFAYAFKVAFGHWADYKLPDYKSLPQFHEALRKGLPNLDRDSASLIHTMARDWILLNRKGSKVRDLVAAQMRSMVEPLIERDPFAEFYIQTKLDAALEELHATSQTVRSNLTLLFAAPAFKKTLSDEVYGFKKGLVGKVRSWLNAQISLDMEGRYDFLTEDRHINTQKYISYYEGRWGGATTFTDDYGGNKWWYSTRGDTTYTSSNTAGSTWRHPKDLQPKARKKDQRKTTFKTSALFSMREDRALLDDPFEGLSVATLATDLLWGIHDTLYRQSNAYAYDISLEEFEGLYGREGITFLGTPDYARTDVFPEELDIKTLTPRDNNASSVFAYEGPIKVGVSIFVGSPKRSQPLVTCSCRATITLELPDTIWKYSRGDE